MIRKKQSCTFLFLLINFSYCSAQLFAPKNYPQNYFGWPVATALKGIVANFGELRPNHYHMGLDCRTDQKQNLPVLAAADGYIAKVKIESFGFGRAIYINHPNGFTTLYAHLNNFNPELEKYVTEQQYKLKSWKVFLDIPAGLFPVKKGTFIAYSGNTGGSQGPHVHFEIRDTQTDKVLNPSLFGFPLPDNVPPTIFRLAVYDRSISTYEQSPKFYPVKKLKDGYAAPLIVCNTDKISFGITATDKYSGSNNPNGIYEATVYDNETPVIGFQLDNISYDETRYLNAHIDYKLRSSGGPWVEHLSRLPGYTNSIYKPGNSDGVVSLEDDSIHHIKIAVKDAYGNTSLLQFEIKRVPAVAEKIKSAANPFMGEKNFQPGFINLFENSNISFYLPENALYDSIRFKYNEMAAASGYTIFQLHNTSVPVQTYFPVKIKAASPLPGKMVMHRFSNGKDDYAKTEYESGWYKASFREFGSFQLLVDTIAPGISPVGFHDNMNCSKLSSLRFVVLDNTEEIKNFTATIDGNWIRCSNDKGRTFIYVFDEYCPPGEHELKITAEDQVGNVAEKIYHFTR
jgi:murein DD-endopeptidase MepM/ murein hydrolase activator NlpD